MPLNNEVEKLTKREIEIAILICQEKSSKQIAAELEIEISTVDSHKKSLRKKTGSQTVIGIVIYCYKRYSHLLLSLSYILPADIADAFSF